MTSHLCVEGTYTVDFNIIFATRNGYVYKLQRGLDQPECLTSLMSLPVAMELDNSRFLVACTDSTLLSFSLKVIRAHMWYLIVQSKFTLFTYISWKLSCREIYTMYFQFSIFKIKKCNCHKLRSVLMESWLSPRDTFLLFDTPCKVFPGTSA